MEWESIEKAGRGCCVVKTRSESETERLGQALAEVVRPGMTLGLVGPLGAGKTRLTRALVEALGVDPEEVGSPTFVLIREYQGVYPIYHFDVYRMKSPDEFEVLGGSDYFRADALCIVEWADRVASDLPRATIWVEIEPLDSTGRRFMISVPRGTEPLLDALSRSLAD